MVSRATPMAISTAVPPNGRFCTEPVLPNLFLQMGNTGSVQNLPFGGTAVLIMIGVGLDTVKQIESQLMQRNYEGFLK